MKRRSVLSRVTLVCGTLAVLALLYVVFLRPLSSAHVTTVANEPPPAVAAAKFHQIDDAAMSVKTQHFVYVGSWEHIRHARDGRSAGTSSRSYHIGDSAFFMFRGVRFKILGIKGPNGGAAEMSIDDKPSALLRFFAPHKQAGVELYASPKLAPGMHSVNIVVIEALNGPAKRRYVNIDGAAYAPE